MPFSLSVLLFQVMYGGRIIDDFDRRIVRVYMDEYMGDFLFDTFQPFHFYRDENVDYRIPIAQQRQEFIGELAPVNVEQPIVENNNFSSLFCSCENSFR
jgi:Dynein heavy chain AAA lid domain